MYELINIYCYQKAILEREKYNTIMWVRIENDLLCAFLLNTKTSIYLSIYLSIYHFLLFLFTFFTHTYTHTYICEIHWYLVQLWVWLCIFINTFVAWHRYINVCVCVCVCGCVCVCVCPSIFVFQLSSPDDWCSRTLCCGIVGTCLIYRIWLIT